MNRMKKYEDSRTKDENMQRNNEGLSEAVEEILRSVKDGDKMAKGRAAKKD